MMTVPVAGEGLVVMAVSLNSNWKVPCGYFLINGMTGIERANLICQCLLKLKDIGVLVKTVTFDGPACNFAMLDCLGIELSPPLVIKTWFLHPADFEYMGGKINWNCVEQLGFYI